MIDHLTPAHVGDIVTYGRGWRARIHAVNVVPNSAGMAYVEPLTGPLLSTGAVWLAASQLTADATDPRD